MDTLDVAILRETSHPRASFQWNFRETYREIAEKLDVDEETVRLRVKRLQEEQVLLGFELVVNPALLGQTLVRVDLPTIAPSRKDALIEQVRHLDGARWVFDHYDGGMGVVFFSDPAAIPRLVALVESLAGCPGEPWVLGGAPCTVEPTPLDWRIIDALRRDPRRAYGEVAEELGVSSKTVKRRVARLIEGRACFMSSIVDLGRARGVISVEVIARHAPGADPAPMDAFLLSIPNRVFERRGPHVSAISFAAFSMAEVDAVRRRLAETPGGSGARANVLLRRITLDAWLDERIRREAEAARGSAGSAATSGPPSASAR